MNVRPIQLSPLFIAVALCYSGTASAQTTPATDSNEMPTVTVTTAEESLKQAPGVSTITASDIEKRPPVNDLSDIIRTMPGVNLTGNSSTGQRGNNRQIDLRGMGPENTLILIDGKPVSSRTSVRYGKSGERDTRGDSNWVPAEEVDHIEVIRGPAAARYGSGAAGGVVNIITKGITKTTQGSVTMYTSQPQHSDEGDTKRIDMRVAGPIGDEWGYRLYANYNRTDADDSDINVDNTASTASTAAGREGVKNKDVNLLLRWQPTSGQALDFNLGYSRQGNIYAGDTQTGSSATSESTSTASSYLGKETNTMIRQTYSVEHRGRWAFGNTKTYLQYEHTDNRRLDEGLVGGTEGNINSAEKQTATLSDIKLHSEVDMPLHFALPQTMTAGVEWDYQKLDDPASVTNSVAISGVSGLADDASDRQTDNSARMISMFIEDNMQFTDALLVTPGLRVDQHSEFGINWSPSLNMSYMLTPVLTLKGGVARAFKAPNLYQSNPNYLLYSSGNGCNKTLTYTTACYLLGNADLKPETSINKEIGINWSNQGWNAGLTWFRNDYTNKIVSGTDLIGIVTVSGSERYVYRWENATSAIIEGFEGNLLVPLAADLKWSNNFTYMRRNDDQNGQPLSVIPQFTINTTLDWQASEKWSYTLTGTFYGRQKPRTVLYSTSLAASGDQLTEVSPYNIWGISAGYRINPTWKTRFGISNIFDKRLYREGNSYSAGAASYNEPGRAFYASLTADF